MSANSQPPILKGPGKFLTDTLAKILFQNILSFFKKKQCARYRTVQYTCKASQEYFICKFFVFVTPNF